MHYKTIHDLFFDPIDEKIEPIKTRQDLDSSGKSVIHGKLNIESD